MSCGSATGQAAGDGGWTNVRTEAPMGTTTMEARVMISSERGKRQLVRAGMGPSKLCVSDGWREALTDPAHPRGAWGRLGRRKQESGGGRRSDRQKQPVT